MSREHSTRVPDLLLEKLALGELSADERARVLAELEAEEGGLARLEAIEADDETFLERFPPGPALGEQRRRLARRRGEISRRRMRWVALPSLALAATAALMLVMPQLRSQDVTPPTALPGTGLAGHSHGAPGIRLKGPALLFVHKKVGKGRDVQLDHGAEVRPGDLIQLSYRASEARHGVIFSIDGRGSVTLHFPAASSEPTKLLPKGTQALPNAFELDDAPRFERIFLVSAKTPLDVDSILAAARRLGAKANAPLSLSGAGDLAIKDVLLRKPTPGSAR